MIADLPRITAHPRGERLVEGVFNGRARADGNTVGYDTIAASGPHACILHWTRNDGPVVPGDLILMDAGVELDSYYTADITRTFPIDGTFSETQRQIYEAVLEAADAAFAIVRPGIRFREIHATAMAVIARRTAEWGLLPVSAEEALKADNQQHRRYMVHGTSHHLGLDVHDCAQARRELYLDGVLEPGMVFTIEPGLYFQPDDLTVPERFRGIGVRIEDNILVTADGAENLSAAIPRTADDVEAWVRSPLRAERQAVGVGGRSSPGRRAPDRRCRGGRRGRRVGRMLRLRGRRPSGCRRGRLLGSPALQEVAGAVAEFGVDEHGVAGGDDLLDGREVAAAAVDAVRDEPAQHPEARRRCSSAANTKARLTVGEKMMSSRPKKMPSHAPEAAPARATRPQVSLPVTRSTLFRSLPTMETLSTGKSARASTSTASCAPG